MVIYEASPACKVAMGFLVPAKVRSGAWGLGKPLITCGDSL